MRQEFLPDGISVIMDLVEILASRKSGYKTDNLQERLLHHSGKLKLPDGTGEDSC